MTGNANERESLTMLEGRGLADPPASDSGKQTTDLSIVTTMYRSAAFVSEFYRRSVASAEKLTDRFEIIFVNDGSPDESLKKAVDLVASDSRVKVVDLSRNFGHHKAMMTGLAHSSGALVFLIDSDLEESPELLLSFHDELERRRADVVYGYQEKRQGNVFKRWSGRAFYSLFNLLSETRLPPNLCTVRLMTRRYVRSLLAYRERETNISGLWVLTGYEQIGLAVTRDVRAGTNYTLARRIKTFVDAVTAFSNRPLVLIFYIGLLISLVAGAAAAYLVIQRLFFGTLLAGWPSLIVSIWLLGGINLFCIGLLGIYLSRVFVETKQRPYTIVREVFTAESASSPAATTNGEVAE
jgi:putative glycosyltransferase